MKIKKNRLDQIIKEELIREVDIWDGFGSPASDPWQAMGMPRPVPSMDIIKNINPLEFLPVIGDAIDLKLFFDAMGEGDVGGMAMAGIFLLPLGDLAKLMGKTKKQTKEIKKSLEEISEEEMEVIVELAVREGLGLTDEAMDALKSSQKAKKAAMETEGYVRRAISDGMNSKNFELINSAIDKNIKKIKRGKEALKGSNPKTAHARKIKKEFQKELNDAHRMLSKSKKTLLVEGLDILAKNDPAGYLKLTTKGMKTPEGFKLYSSMINSRWNFLQAAWGRKITGVIAGYLIFKFGKSAWKWYNEDYESYFSDEEAKAAFNENNLAWPGDESEATTDSGDWDPEEIKFIP